MTKQEFIEKWGNHSIYHSIMPDINSVIAAAISEHEAGKWKKYPENKPDKQGVYFLKTWIGLGYSVDEWMIDGMGVKYWRRHSDIHVISFCEPL